MTKIGRSKFALLNEATNTPADTGGIINLTEKFLIPRSELKSAISIAAAAGVAGYLTITIAGTYAVGDLVRITITSNLTSRQLWRKSYVHRVQAGATTVTDIAAAFAALISADIAPGSPYASASNVAGVLTVTQYDDDKRGLVGYVYTDSAAGTIANVPTATVISEGQPSDLVDMGIPADEITAASYTTVRIAFQHEVAVPFVDSVGAVAKEIVWYGTPAQAAALVALIP